MVDPPEKLSMMKALMMVFYEVHGECVHGKVSAVRSFPVKMKRLTNNFL
jgi:hypothetical protein